MRLLPRLLRATVHTGTRFSLRLVVINLPAPTHPTSLALWLLSLSLHSPLRPLLPRPRSLSPLPRLGAPRRLTPLRHGHPPLASLPPAAVASPPRPASAPTHPPPPPPPPACRPATPYPSACRRVTSPPAATALFGEFELGEPSSSAPASPLANKEPRFHDISTYAVVSSPPSSPIPSSLPRLCLGLSLQARYSVGAQGRATFQPLSRARLPSRSRLGLLGAPLRRSPSALMRWRCLCRRVITPRP